MRPSTFPAPAPRGRARLRGHPSPLPLLLLLPAVLGCTEKPLLPLPPNGDGDTLVSFREQIVPLLTARYGCAAASCHGGNPPASGYRLPGYDTIFGPGQQAAERGLLDVRPGRPDSSFMVWKLEGETPSGDPLTRMPFGRPDPIDPGDLELIRAWIRQGAPDN